MEDLELAPSRDKDPRPTLKFLMVGEHDDDETEDLLPDDLEPESVGLLLETWDTLNVYCEVFQLDSFTFDDFLQAMRYSSEEMDCELFVEIHCAILKKLVNSEDEDGAVQVSLPDFPAEESDHSEEEGEEEEDNGEDAPEPKSTRMTTRGSLAKKEADAIKSQLTEEPANERVHRAAEMFEKYGWMDRLRRRDFRNGGWELVMIGLLHQLSVRPRYQKTCDDILQHLAPLDLPATQKTARDQYRTLDVNLRVKALQIICMLSLETKAIRNYLEECSNQMTEFRKVKIEHQKARKAA